MRCDDGWGHQTWKSVWTRWASGRIGPRWRRFEATDTEFGPHGGRTEQKLNAAFVLFWLLINSRRPAVIPTGPPESFLPWMNITALLMIPALFSFDESNHAGGGKLFPQAPFRSLDTRQVQMPCFCFFFFSGNACCCGTWLFDLRLLRLHRCSVTHDWIKQSLRRDRCQIHGFLKALAGTGGFIFHTWLHRTWC